jgi:hypothetical protein
MIELKRKRTEALTNKRVQLQEVLKNAEISNTIFLKMYNVKGQPYLLVLDEEDKNLLMTFLKKKISTLEKTLSLNS